jgi:arginase
MNAAQRKSIILGAPFALGQELCGVDLGPSELRKLSLVEKIQNLGWKVEDAGNLELPTGAPERVPGEKLVSPLQTGVACKKIHDAVTKLAQANPNAFMTVLGGDHSIALGSISGLLKVRPDTCVLWVDAHADINTPTTSESGHIHGMPVAGLIGAFDPSKEIKGFEWLKPCLSPERIAYVGLRDIDTPEKEILKRLKIKVFTMSDVDQYGMSRIVQMALDHINPERRRPIHVSFDIDSLDPLYAPSTGTKVLGGLTFREARILMETIYNTGMFSSMDLVEINPNEQPEMLRCDTGGYNNPPVNKTVAVGVELILFAHGKRLL